MSVQIVVFGTDELLKRINQYRGYISSPQFRALLEDAGNAYVMRARADAPISRSPGAKGGLVAGGSLRSSIHHRIDNFGTQNVTLRIGAGGPGAGYAQYVEEGTKDSMRFAVNKKVMFWLEDGAGRTVQQHIAIVGSGNASATGFIPHYRTSVWHPGTRAQPFFFKHAQPITQRLILAIQRQLTEIFRGGGQSA